MNNPFESIRLQNPDIADTLADAFACARDIDQVFACLRFHRLQTGAELYGYIDGGFHFAAWQCELHATFKPEGFDEVRELAWDYLYPPQEDTNE
jgi:hypothetical protein